MLKNKQDKQAEGTKGASRGSRQAGTVQQNSMQHADVFPIRMIWTRTRVIRRTHEGPVTYIRALQPTYCVYTCTGVSGAP